MRKEFKVYDICVCKEDCKDCNQRECKVIEPTMRLVKKKINKNYVPPDMSAVKLLDSIDVPSESLTNKTDAELIVMRNELLDNLIKNELPVLKKPNKLLHNELLNVNVSADCGDTTNVFSIKSASHDTSVRRKRGRPKKTMC